MSRRLILILSFRIYVLHFQTKQSWNQEKKSPPPHSTANYLLIQLFNLSIYASTWLIAVIRMLLSLSMSLEPPIITLYTYRSGITSFSALNVSGCGSLYTVRCKERIFGATLISGIGPSIFLTWRRPGCRLRCRWYRATWPRVGTTSPLYPAVRSIWRISGATLISGIS